MLGCLRHSHAEADIAVDVLNLRSPIGPNASGASSAADTSGVVALAIIAIVAGGDPAVIARWISETEATRAAYEATKTPEPLPVMTRDEIAAVVESLANLPGLLSAADPADKADIYAGIGLRLTYQPEPRSVLAEVRFADQPHWRSECVRGANAPINQWALTGEFAVRDVS